MAVIHQHWEQNSQILNLFSANALNEAALTNALLGITKCLKQEYRLSYWTEVRAKWEIPSFRAGNSLKLNSLENAF